MVDKDLERALAEDMKKRERIFKLRDEKAALYEKRDMSASMEEAIASIANEKAETYHIDAGGFDLKEFLRDKASMRDSYDKYIGGKVGKESSGETMVQCPFPDHDDNNPSANINEEKMVGYCYVCAAPFDVFDMAGIAYNINPRSMDFPQLMFEVGQDLGYNMVSVDSRPVVQLPDGTQLGVPTEAIIASIEEMDAALEEVQIKEYEFGIPWWTEDGALFPKGTFLDTWIQAHRDSGQRVAEEFAVATGMVALAQIAGPNLKINFEEPSHAAIPVVLMGATGSGKTTAVRALRQLLDEVNPWEHDDGATTMGTRWLEGGASGEILIKELDRNRYKEDEHSVINESEGIRAVIYYDEFEQLTTIASKMGSTLRGVLMKFMTNDPNNQHISLKEGDNNAHNTCTSIITTSQPDALTGFMSSHDQYSGWVNRWLFFTGESKIRQRGSSNINIDDAAEILKDLRGFWSTRGIPTVQLTDGAGDLLHQYLINEIDPLTTGEDDAALELVRMDFHLKRILLCMALNEQKLLVDTPMARRVIQLSRSYFVKSATDTAEKMDDSYWGRVNDAIIQTAATVWMNAKKELEDEGELADNINIQHQIAKNKKATMGKILNHSRVSREANKTNKTKATQIFKLLVEQNALRKEPTTNPSVHHYFITSEGISLLEFVNAT